MRPRKRILLFSTDETQLHLVGFPLGLHNFRIYAATDRKVAMQIAEREDIDCAVLLRNSSKDGCFRLADDLDRMRINRILGFRVVLVNYVDSTPLRAPVHHVLSGVEVGPADILAAVNSYAQNKRGPKVRPISVTPDRSTVQIYEKARVSA